MAAQAHPPNAVFEEILERGGTVKDLRRQGASKRDALHAYASHYAGKHEPPPAPTCCNCQDTPGLMAIYTWRAIFNTRFAPNLVDVALLFVGFVRLSTKSDVIDFKTHHAVCERCWRRLTVKRVAANVLQFFGLFFGVISLVVSAIGLASYVYFRTDRHWSDSLSGMLWTGVGGIGVLLLSALMLRVASALRVLKPLRIIARRPFCFLAVAKGASGGGFPVEAG